MHALASPGRVWDKHGRLDTLADATEVTLELGCGPRKRHSSAIGIDALDYAAVDVVGDVFDVLARVPDGAVDAVHSYHFVEHVDDPGRLIAELRRVLKIGGLVKTVAPHFSNPYYYSDYTHRRPYGLYSFSYLADDHLFRRRVPRYAGDTGFELISVRLIFKAPPPFYVRYAFRRILQSIVNLATYTQEAYEAGWCFWFPCYEVEYVVIRRR